MLLALKMEKEDMEPRNVALSGLWGRSSVSSQQGSGVLQRLGPEFC